jgi:hypothetical protein
MTAHDPLTYRVSDAVADRVSSVRPSSLADRRIQVPVAVWRLAADPDGVDTTGAPRTLEARLASRLVEIFTGRGDTIVDLDDDHEIRRAATAMGRGYQRIANSRGLANVATKSPVGLIVMRWPRTAPLTSVREVHALLAGSRSEIVNGAAVVAAFRDARFDRRQAGLVDVAHAAGLVHAMRVAVLSAPPDRGDQFLYNSTPNEFRQIAVEALIDLLVFDLVSTAFARAVVRRQTNRPAPTSCSRRSS